MSGLLRMMAGVISGARDVTPDAVNWADIGPGDSPQSNADQTLQNFDGTITLEANWTGSGAFGGYSLNGGGYTIIANGGTVDVTDGDTLNWRFTRTVVGTSTGTVTITNESDGSATLDTFTYSVTGTGA